MIVVCYQARLGLAIIWVWRRRISLWTSIRRTPSFQQAIVPPSFTRNGVYTIRYQNHWKLVFTWAASLGRELSGINEIDFRLDYQLSEQFKLSGGYRWLNYEYGLEEDESNIEVELRGPFIGLYLPF